MKTKSISFKITAAQASAISNYVNDCNFESLYPGFTYKIWPDDSSKDRFIIAFIAKNTFNLPAFIKDLFDLAYYSGRESVFITE